MTGVLGLDGCRGGWCGVMIEVRDGATRPQPPKVFRTFADALATAAGVIGIDIPIGLLDCPGRRPCDQLARRLLGPPTASSVFPPPSRRASAVTDYWDASAVNLAVAGTRLTKQSFLIAPKIHEVDTAMTPSMQTRVFEVHPELCFWALNGGRRLPRNKRSRAGKAHRLDLLSVVLNGLATSPPRPGDLPEGCRPDDYLDALAAAWTALCIFEGRALRVPAGPQQDARGLRMEIWYPPPAPVAATGERRSGPGAHSPG